jgi:hypothetical protein
VTPAESLARFNELKGECGSLCDDCAAGTAPMHMDAPDVHWFHSVAADGSHVQPGTGVMTECGASALRDEMETIRAAISQYVNHTK